MENTLGYSINEQMISQNTKVWFISRHEGAVSWAKRKNLPITDWCEHLDISQINSGDIVMGTLPIHLAAMVCSRGAIFYYLEMSVPPELRGKELTDEFMVSIGCKLTQFNVIQGDAYDL